MAGKLSLPWRPAPSKNDQPCPDVPQNGVQCQSEVAGKTADVDAGLDIGSGLSKAVHTPTPGEGEDINPDDIIRVDWEDDGCIELPSRIGLSKAGPTYVGEEIEWALALPGYLDPEDIVEKPKIAFIPDSAFGEVGSVNEQILRQKKRETIERIERIIVKGMRMTLERLLRKMIEWCLNWIREHAARTYQVPAKDVSIAKLCLTVPQSWRGPEVDIYRNAAQQAGCSDVRIRYEADSAAVWIAIFEDFGDLKMNQKFTVFDVGNGTGDTATYEITEMDDNKVIGLRPFGTGANTSYCGSYLVNLELLNRGIFEDRGEKMILQQTCKSRPEIELELQPFVENIKETPDQDWDYYITPKGSGLPVEGVLTQESIALCTESVIELMAAFVKENMDQNAEGGIWKGAARYSRLFGVGGSFYSKTFSKIFRDRMIEVWREGYQSVKASSADKDPTPGDDDYEDFTNLYKGTRFRTYGSSLKADPCMVAIGALLADTMFNRLDDPDAEEGDDGIPTETDTTTDDFS